MIKTIMCFDGNVRPGKSTIAIALSKRMKDNRKTGAKKDETEINWNKD